MAHRARFCQLHARLLPVSDEVPQESKANHSMMRSNYLALLLAVAMPAAACGDDDDAAGPADSGPDAAAPSVNLDGGSSLDTSIPSDARSDASSSETCGSWQVVRFTDRPPADAEPYGLEINSMGTYSQYVCRFRDTLDTRPLVLQGKGVFGFSCYAVLPAGETAPARVQPSADFEVLVGSKDCARMVPYDPSLRLMPTGVDVDGERTYTCRGVVNSVDLPGVTTRPLGRFDPVRKSCVFEWYSNVREAPRLEGEQFEVLAIF
jgi:hypothetical protein